MSIPSEDEACDCARCEESAIRIKRRYAHPGVFMGWWCWGCSVFHNVEAQHIRGWESHRLVCQLCGNTGADNRNYPGNLSELPEPWITRVEATPA